MKKLNYFVLDVFADQKYQGNQLSVVYLEEELTLTQYHEIAREFGYSETSFIHYSTEENALVVRSFTPAEFEVVGAGHNLLGAVCLALLQGRDIFKSHGIEPYVIIKDMRIPVRVTKKANLPYVAMKQSPAQVLSAVPADLVAKGIGLSVDDLKLNGWEIKIVKTEVPHLMIPIKDEQTLQLAQPNKSLLRQTSEEYGFEGYYLFTTNHQHTEYLAEARFFNPGIGIDEDPATGTAAGPLAGYLEKLGYIKTEQDLRVLQGTAVKHPSTIHVRVSNEGIWVSGSSVIVMEGTIYL